MENKQSPSKKKLISIREEKREVDYDFLTGCTNRLPKKELLLDLEIFPKHSARRPSSQRILVSIKPRVPAIQTLFLAEKKHFFSKKGSEKSGSQYAIGDHSSYITHFSANPSYSNTITCEPGRKRRKKEPKSIPTAATSCSTAIVKCCKRNVQPYSNIHEEQCMDSGPPSTMNSSHNNDAPVKTKHRQTADVATLIHKSHGKSERLSFNILNKLFKKVEQLERKVIRQEMVFRLLDPTIPLSSSDEESRDETMISTSGTGRPGCSYIQQYSHMPETSAFQRYTQNAAPLSPSRATTIEKEHNSEQYGRDFTAYDEITARGKRHCSSLPGKRDELPKMATERVHRIRRKLNPVRDYRLMDTVHYLAQGEFAPRDDGIKLTPSREAVLSDIIYEDVCRTHWPAARLSRRSERHSARCELQRLIDTLLRERVAHVERRRRRHYRIVKLNHRHENSKPVGKTGDIIVASHKNKASDDRGALTSDHHTVSSLTTERQWTKCPRRNNRSHDRFTSAEDRKGTQRSAFRPDENVAGPSGVRHEPTCCYRAISARRACAQSSGSSASACAPRLVVRKDAAYMKQPARDEPDLEHYILLPTLVVRTPSNVKRQKKFNELYHRILNVQMNNACKSPDESENGQRTIESNTKTKDIGFNINIT